MPSLHHKTPLMSLSMISTSRRIACWKYYNHQVSRPPPQYQKQAPHPTKTRPQDNSKPLTLSEKKRKEAALGRQRAHARADTSEMNRVAMDDPTDGLRWAFYLTLSGLWDSFLPSPTSQVPYIAFEFLKH
ncbi:hypothetical protein HZ326_4908 [Fusarium oxysporum f. sp. albedinis]|nr:hypothetical protein HZ326_4908 [Fusarium oxysporum f. sp. albedinis]